MNSIMQIIKFLFVHTSISQPYIYNVFLELTMITESVSNQVIQDVKATDASEPTSIKMCTEPMKN